MDLIVTDPLACLLITSEDHRDRSTREKIARKNMCILPSRHPSTLQSSALHDDSKLLQRIVCQNITEREYFPD